MSGDDTSPRSDTPRTDAAVQKVIEVVDWSPADGKVDTKESELVPADLARQLERELAEATELCALTEQRLIDLTLQPSIAAPIQHWYHGVDGGVCGSCGERPDHANHTPQATTLPSHVAAPTSNADLAQRLRAEAKMGYLSHTIGAKMMREAADALAVSAIEASTDAKDAARWRFIAKHLEISHYKAMPDTYCEIDWHKGGLPDAPPSESLEAAMDALMANVDGTTKE